MAVRTVSVTLKMQISDFELAAAKAAAITKALGDDLDHMGKSANKVSTTKPTKEMQNFSRVLDGAMKDGKTAFQSIQQSIDETKTHITKLKETIRTSSGNPTALFGDLKQAKGDLRVLENALKDIAPEAEKAGAQAGKSFLDGFKLGPLSGPIGAGILAASIPIIVPAVSAAVAAGVGLGVIGAGAYLLRNNDKIQAAFAPLRDDLDNVFTSAAEPLVKPFVDAIGSLDQFIRAEQPAFEQLFASVAPAIGLVTKGVEGFVADLVPALTKVGATFTATLQNPAVQASLRKVSEGFANIFTTIGNNPKEVADGFLIVDSVLTGTEKTVSGLIAVIGPVVEGLKALRTVTDEYGNENIQNPKQQVPGAPPPTGPVKIVRVSQAYEDAAKAAGNFQENAAAANGETRITAQTVTFATGAMDDMLAHGVVPLDAGLQNLDAALQSVSGLTENLTKANVAVKQTLADITKQVDASKKAHDKNATSISIETQTGRDNVGMILASIDANKTAYEKQVGQESATKGTTQALKDANAAYDVNTGKLEANLVKLGFNKKAVDAFIKANSSVPPVVTTTFKVPGLSKAIADAGILAGKIYKIPNSKTIIVTTYYRDVINSTRSGNRGDRWGGFYEHAAVGTLRDAQVYSPVNPGRYMIAEPQTQGEAFIPKRGDYGRSMNILAAAAGWYGARVVAGNNGGGSGGGGQMTLVVTGGDATGAAFVQTMRFAIQQRGGDPIKVLTPA